MRPYDAWNADGRPITPAKPVEDLVNGLKVAYPKGAAQFGWYADEAHYQAQPPQDHTPYSADAWPDPDPEWWVFATDVMVTAVGGSAEAQRLFDYWLASAKNGTAPWIKYLIWKATIYDVRHGWAPQANTGHFDHIHVSVRTDYQHYSLDGWPIQPSPAPKPHHGGDLMQRYAFDASYTDRPPALADPKNSVVVATDGVGAYHVREVSYQLNGAEDKASGAPVVTLTKGGNMPANWSFDETFHQVTGGCAFDGPAGLADWRLAVSSGGGTPAGQTFELDGTFTGKAKQA